MRIVTACLTAASLLATPALAEARGFDSDLNSSITGPLKIEVVVSEDLAHRANNLPKKLSDRGSHSRLNGTFSNNGYYGDREIEYLIEEMQEDLTKNFAKQGIVLSDNAPTLLRVTIEMAKPNRPTFRQLSKDASLSYDSFGIGGAEITAEVIAAGGTELGSASYDYYSSISDHPFGAVGTWSDANRSFSRFSKKLTKKLAALGASTS